MTKKNLTALLLALLLCISLAACGGQTTEKDDGKQDDAVVDTVKDENEADKTDDAAEQDKAETGDKQDAASGSQTTDGTTQAKPQSNSGAASSGSTASTSKPQSTGSGSSSASQSTGSGSSGGSTSTSKPESTPAPQPTPEPEPAQPTAAQASGYIGSSASALEAALGSPSSKSYSPSCMGEGEDGVWSYSGFTVYTYRENGVETVEAVA